MYPCIVNFKYGTTCTGPSKKILDHRFMILYIRTLFAGFDELLGRTFHNSQGLKSFDLLVILNLEALIGGFGGLKFAKCSGGYRCSYSKDWHG